MTSTVHITSSPGNRLRLRIEGVGSVTDAGSTHRPRVGGGAVIVDVGDRCRTGVDRCIVIGDVTTGDRYVAERWHCIFHGHTYRVRDRIAVRVGYAGCTLTESPTFVSALVKVYVEVLETLFPPTVQS